MREEFFLWAKDSVACYVDEHRKSRRDRGGEAQCGIAVKTLCALKVGDHGNTKVQSDFGTSNHYRGCKHTYNRTPMKL